VTNNLNKFIDELTSQIVFQINIVDLCLESEDKELMQQRLEGEKNGLNTALDMIERCIWIVDADKTNILNSIKKSLTTMIISDAYADCAKGLELALDVINEKIKESKND
jgi:pyruvate/2-oxoglutarate/acetoin dehydrogenase E1 component